MSTALPAPAFHVESEVGQLRRVLLHRPDLELRRLTPSNVKDLLFDDVLWVKRARQEHDAFADTLRERGVEVLYVGELLAETMKDETARAWLLDREIDARDLGQDLAVDLRALLDEADPAALAEHLIGGLTVAEMAGRPPRGLRAAVVGPTGFVLPPLPNHLFTRDTTCWIYRGVSLNPMALPARRRETAHLEAIYRFHPLFADAAFDRWFGGTDEDLRAATMEGGDVLVIGKGAVLIGMGERTTPQAVEALARRLFAKGAAHTVVAVALPWRRAYMHLDTVMTMVRPDTFVAYPGVLKSLRTWTLRASDVLGELVVEAQPELFACLQAVLDTAAPGAHHRRRSRRGRAGAVGRRQQRPGRRAGGRHRLRAQRRHQHQAPQGRPRGRDDRRQRARSRPRRPAVHELPARARPRLTQGA